MDDNVMPNDGGFFYGKEPKDQRLGRKREQAQALEALPILQDLINRLEIRIAFYEAISSIPDSVRSDPDKFLIMCNSHTLAAKALSSEKEFIQSLIETYAPHR